MKKTKKEIVFYELSEDELISFIKLGFKKCEDWAGYTDYDPMLNDNNFKLFIKELKEKCII